MYTEFRKLNLFLNVITKETIHMKCSRKKNTADSFRFHILKMIFVFCLLWNLPAFSQSGDKAVLKVYLNDTETGRNVKKARVTLEGFEIPAINAKYDRQGKYYYFAEIPKGYNTVMSYHKDYNEKGFQYVNKLPSIIKLQLHDPRNVSYSFDKPVLKEIRNFYVKKTRYFKELEKQLKEKDSLTGVNFRYVYTEDPYHIAVISKQSPDQFFDEDMIDFIKGLSLVYCPSFLNTKKDTHSCCFFADEGYLFLGKTQEGKYSCNVEEDPVAHPESWVYFFYRSDGEKFDRFNSPEALKLQQRGHIVAGISNRILEYFGYHKFNKKNFFNYGNELFQNIDQYFQFGIYTEPIQLFFKDHRTEYKMTYGGGGLREIIYYDDIPEKYLITSIYLIIPKDISGTLLGGLDIMELNTSDKKFIFTNKFKGF